MHHRSWDEVEALRATAEKLRDTLGCHSHAAGAWGFMGHGPFGRGGRGPRGDWSDMFGGPPPRAERGHVRYLVLDAIADQPRHGYEIIQAIEERSGGTYRPSPGVVYPTLQLLEELGHARLEEKEGRKVYAITDDGKRDLDEHRDEVADFYARSAGDDWADHAEDVGDLMKRVARLFKAFRRMARHGRLTPSTLKKLRGVVDEALARMEELVGRERP
jgi:DNA-binding PadR family transcriptional regulator